MTGKYLLLPPVRRQLYLGYYITVAWVFSRDFSILHPHVLCLNRHGLFEKPPSAINRDEPGWPSVGCARFHHLKTQMVWIPIGSSSMGLFVRDFHNRSNCFRRFTLTVRTGHIYFTILLYIMVFDWYLASVSNVYNVFSFNLYKIYIICIWFTRLGLDVLKNYDICSMV